MSVLSLTCAVFSCHCITIETILTPLTLWPCSVVQTPLTHPRHSVAAVGVSYIDIATALTVRAPGGHASQTCGVAKVAPNTRFTLLTC